MIKSLVMPILKQVARPYIAGDDLDDAVAIAASATGHGYGVTVCYWQAPDETPEATSEQYLATLSRLKAEGMDAHLAIKAPALWERDDLIARVVSAARVAGVPVDFDSHGTEHADANFVAAEKIGGDMLGCVIPGRWRRSLADADRAVELGLRVRVVKGNWEDPNDPDRDSRKGYLDIVDKLAGRCREVGVATHDPLLAREAFARLKAAGTPCVQELLYGLPIEPAAAEGRRAGVPTRIYIPYGEAWFPYSLSKALTRPHTMLWLARDIIRRRAPGVPAPGA